MSETKGRYDPDRYIRRDSSARFIGSIPTGRKVKLGEPLPVVLHAYACTTDGEPRPLSTDVPSI